MRAGGWGGGVAGGRPPAPLAGGTGRRRELGNWPSL